MSKHTPGPWIHWADTNLIIRLHSGAARSEDLRICEVATNTRKDEGRYNARLISAAPEMLEALELALPRLAHKAECARLNPTEVWERDGSWNFSGCVCEISKVRAAIAKATGEQS